MLYFLAYPCESLHVSGFNEHWTKRNFEGMYLIRPKREWCDETHPTYRMKDERILSWVASNGWFFGYNKCHDFVSHV